MHKSDGKHETKPKILLKKKRTLNPLEIYSNSRIEVVRAIAKTAHLENNAVEKAPNTKK